MIDEIKIGSLVITSRSRYGTVRIKKLIYERYVESNTSSGWRYHTFQCR